MTDEETERVTMLWPKSLKAKVKEVAGPRGITEFSIAAVEQHLGVAPSIDDTARELNEARHQAQVFADKLVLGGDNDDRLQALMEVEFPDWIDIVGWPKAYADLVTSRRALEAPAPEAPLEQDGKVYVDETQIVRVPVHREPDAPTPAAVPLEVPADAPTPVAAPVAVPTKKTDNLFDRVMKQTGQDLSGVPGLVAASDVHNHAWVRDKDGTLNCACGSWIDDLDPEYPNGIVREPSGAGGAPADHGAVRAASAVSEPTTPAPEPGHLAPSGQPCPDTDLIDGECWTCGYVAS